MVWVGVIEAVNGIFRDCDGGTRGETVVAIGKDDTEVVAVVRGDEGSESFDIRFVVMQRRPAFRIESDSETGVFAIGLGSILYEVDLVLDDGVKEEAGRVVGHPPHHWIDFIIVGCLCCG